VVHEVLLERGGSLLFLEREKSCTKKNLIYLIHIIDQIYQLFNEPKKVKLYLYLRLE
jgi:hypothetical protein